MDGRVARHMLNLIPLAYFRLQSATEQLHATRKLSTGLRGLMVSLEELGPTTAVRLADMRPVSRQAIHRLAQQLLERQFIRQVVNPHDGRAPLLELTAKGRAELRCIRELEEPRIKKLTLGLPAADMERTARTLEELCLRLSTTTQEATVSQTRRAGKVKKMAG